MTTDAQEISANVCLAHQWFAARRGGERTTEEIARLFPRAPVATLVLNRAALGGDLPGRDFLVSPLRYLSPRFVDHRVLLPAFPWAVRHIRVPRRTRMMVSSDASLIKGMVLPPGCVHVCYCHSPPRYLWDMAEEYAARSAGMGPFRRFIFRRTLGRLRAFDRAGAARVDHFIANSQVVRDRIRRIYGREATVIHPPVDISRFAPTSTTEDFYLIVAELVSYKRVDLAVDACSRLGRRLIVVGDGPELQSLRSAAGDKVEFLGRVRDAEVALLMSRSRAFLHPQVEDFGIAAVESQAAGRPVIALRAGGARETVIHGETGVFFGEQSVDALISAIREFEAGGHRFAIEACRANASRFSAERFRRDFATFLTERQLLSF